MKNTLRFSAVALAALSLAACGSDSGGSGQRDALRIVGSSTVYPFAKLVAENFARSNPELGSPVIESTGSGAGIALFCAGVGADTPDIVNASRRMKASELATCAENGVTSVTELQVGLDGIAFAAANGGLDMNLTPEIVYRAIAAAPYGEEQTAMKTCPSEKKFKNDDDEEAERGTSIAEFTTLLWERRMDETQIMYQETQKSDYFRHKTFFKIG